MSKTLEIIDRFARRQLEDLLPQLSSEQKQFFDNEYQAGVRGIAKSKLTRAILQVDKMVEKNKDSWVPHKKWAE